MGIERESRFTSATALSAAWGYVEGSFVNVCLTQGRTFVDKLRAVLRMTAGAWDDALQAQLIALAQSLGAGWQIVLSDLRAAAAERTLVGHDLSLQFGIWVAYYRANGRRFDAIRIFSGTIPPVWGVQPPATRGPSLVAYDPSVDQDPVILDPAALAVAVSRSTTGVRLEPGRPGPVSTTRIVTQESAVSPGVVIVVSLLVVVGVVALTRKRSESVG